jgi:hypothetical protein
MARPHCASYVLPGNLCSCLVAPVMRVHYAVTEAATLALIPRCKTTCNRPVACFRGNVLRWRSIALVPLFAGTAQETC